MTTPPVQRPDEDDDFFDDDDDDLDAGSAMPIAGARGRQALRAGDGVEGWSSERHARYADYGNGLDAGGMDHEPRSASLHDRDDQGGSGEVDDDDDWLDDDEADEVPPLERHTPHAARKHDAASFGMDEPMSDDTLDEGIAPLPAMLTCEAGRLAVSVREIRELQAGQVIDLGRSMLDGVSLMLDGREIARGMLVDLEGRFGIMLTALTEGAHHG